MTIFAPFDLPKPSQCRAPHRITAPALPAMPLNSTATFQIKASFIKAWYLHLPFHALCRLHATVVWSTRAFGMDDALCIKPSCLVKSAGLTVSGADFSHGSRYKRLEGYTELYHQIVPTGLRQSSDPPAPAVLIVASPPAEHCRPPMQTTV